MKLVESYRKYILLFTISLVLVALIIGYVRGGSQEKKFAEVQLNYSQLVNSLQTGNYSDIVNLAGEVDSDLRNTDLFNYVLAIAELNIGNYERSTQYFERAIDINPYKVEDGLFMLQYAETLILASKNEEAEIVLERCTSLEAPDSFAEYYNKITELQQQLDQQT